MNSSRSFVSVGLLLSCLVSLPPLVSATFADSTVPPPNSVSETTWTINPTKGPSFEVEYVGYWSMDSFRYRAVDGEVGYLTGSRIRSIEDATGKDLLPELRRERSSSGVFRPGKHHATGPFFKRPFLAKPLRERSHYLVLEFGTSARTTPSVRSDNQRGLFSTGIGAIRNLSPRWGLGGMVQFQSDGQDYKVISAGVRLRRYLSGSHAIETTQGLFASSLNGRRGVPYFGEVAVSAADAVSLFTRVENQDYDRTYVSWGPTPGGYLPAFERRVETSEIAVHVGLRLGPRPNYLSIPGFLVGTFATLLPGDRELY